MGTERSRQRIATAQRRIAFRSKKLAAELATNAGTRLLGHAGALRQDGRPLSMSAADPVDGKNGRKADAKRPLANRLLTTHARRRGCRSLCPLLRSDLLRPNDRDGSEFSRSSDYGRRMNCLRRATARRRPDGRRLQAVFGPEQGRLPARARLAAVDFLRPL